MNQTPSKELEHELLTLADFLYDDTATDESVTLKIQQVLQLAGVVHKTQVIEDDYGLFMWASAKVLAEYLWTTRDVFQGHRVLEVSRLMMNLIN